MHRGNPPSRAIVAIVDAEEVAAVHVPVTEPEGDRVPYLLPPLRERGDE